MVHMCTATSQNGNEWILRKKLVMVMVLAKLPDIHNSTSIGRNTIPRQHHRCGGNPGIIRCPGQVHDPVLSINCTESSCELSSTDIIDLDGIGALCKIFAVG